MWFFKGNACWDKISLMGTTVTLMKDPNMATDVKRVPMTEHKALKIASITRRVLLLLCYQNILI